MVVTTVPAHIFSTLRNDFLLSSPMPTSYLIGVEAKTLINEKMRKRNTSTSAVVFSYMRFGREFPIFLISLSGQMEPSDRGYSVGFWNDKQEGVEDTWAELLRGLKFSHVELKSSCSQTCSHPQVMLPWMEIRIRVPRWWPRWISLVFLFNLRKRIFMSCLKHWNAYLFMMNILTSDTLVVLRLLSVTNSFIAASKTQSVSFGRFPQHPSDLTPQSV